MKKLSKIVALLLAGAMAMLMFTACSGGGGSADTQKEEAIRKQLGTKTEAVKLCDMARSRMTASSTKKLQNCWMLESRLKPVHLAFSLLILMSRASILQSSM